MTLVSRSLQRRSRVDAHSRSERWFASSSETSAAVRFARGTEVEAGELRARADAKLPEDVPQVEGDRARAEEELRRDLAVGQPARDELRDLELLSGELASGAGVSFPRRLAARAQLHTRPLRPQRRSKPLEGIERRPQMHTRVDAAPAATEKLAVGELGAGALKGAGALSVNGERCLEEPFGLLFILGDERVGVQDDR